MDEANAEHRLVDTTKTFERGEELPPRFFAQRCEFRWPAAGTAYPVDARFEQCRFVVKKMEDAVWGDAQLHSCSFEGLYVGNDFGPSDEDCTGSVVRCDFSKATLDMCRFFGCDLRDQRLPDWPGFVMLSPGSNPEPILRAGFPGAMAGWVSALAHESKSLLAAADDAQALARRYHVKVAAIEKCLSRLGELVRRS